MTLEDLHLKAVSLGFTFRLMAGGVFEMGLPPLGLDAARDAEVTSLDRHIRDRWTEFTAHLRALLDPTEGV